MGQHSELYTTWRWRLRRKAQLQRQPLCERCRDVYHRVTQASIVHHITPHRGDLHAFYYGALMSLCQVCHDGDVQSIEKAARLDQQSD
jgi:5-methylcytosine-specific restriction endonuclease McrA